MKYVLIFTLLISANYCIANQWVIGKVEVVEEYGSYGNGEFGVLVTISEKEWSGDENGAAECTQRFSIETGAQGVTEEIKNRMYSMLLAGLMSRNKVGLYVNPNGPYCKVQITRIING